MIPPRFSKMSKLIIQGFVASREIVSQEAAGCPWYADESGCQTHVFFRHMGATPAIPGWLPPPYGSPSVSSLHQDFRHSPVRVPSRVRLGFRLCQLRSLAPLTHKRERRTLQSLPCLQLCSATRAIMEESSIMNREKSRLVG